MSPVDSYISKRNTAIGLTVVTFLLIVVAVVNSTCYHVWSYYVPSGMMWLAATLTWQTVFKAEKSQQLNSETGERKMSHNEVSDILMVGDPVFYVGEKYKQELSAKEGKSYVGWLHARVENQKGAWVVYFPETKEQDSYILDAKNLTKYRPKSDGPSIMPRRMKREDE